MNGKILAAACLSLLFCLPVAADTLAETGMPDVSYKVVETASDQQSVPDAGTVAWFNATYAVATQNMNGDPFTFAGFVKCDDQKKCRKSQLQTEWDISKKGDVTDTILWLVGTGDRDELGDKAAAWDYSRAMQISGWAYLAGYYTKQEAMDIQLGIASVIQDHFSSWDEYVDSYLAGFYLNSGDDVELQRRSDIYELQKESANNPYAVDWDINLGKTW